MGTSSVKNCRVFQITSEELRERSARAFRDFAGAQPGASKRIACALRCSNRTAQNYLDGLHIPSGVHDLRAMRFVPHYEAMKREIAELDRSLDPRVQAKLVELAQIVAQYGHTLFGGESD